MIDTCPVPFTATGGSGPLTWGQRSILRVLATMGERSHYFNLGKAVPVPAGRSLAQVTDAVRTLVERHPGLRTRFPDYPVSPRQSVMEHGTVPLQVHHASADELDRISDEVATSLGRRCFEHETEWPVRFAVVLVDGRPRRLVLIASHLVVDGAGFRSLLGELGQRLDGAPVTDDGTWSPLAIADHEQSDAGRAATAAALRHWRDELETSPPSIFDLPMYEPEPRRYWGLRISSAAIAVASARIAAEARCSTSAVLLAAVAAVLGHYTGHSRVPMQVVTSNRWRPELARAVVPLTQDGRLSPELTDVSFREFLGRTWRQSLRTYQTAAYDPAELEALVGSVEQLRGAHVDRDVLFNDTRPIDGWPLPPGADAEQPTSIEVLYRSERPVAKAFFSVLSAELGAVVILQFDTAFLPAETARQVLTGLEALVTRAASHDVRLDEVGDITRIAPVSRGEGWVRVGGADEAQWVDLAEVRKLVAAVPDVACCWVSPSAGPGQLVAHLVPARPGTGPDDVHAAVCSRLGQRTDVMAPQHYVLHAEPPADNSPAAWLALPVSASGSGRRRDVS